MPLRIRKLTSLRTLKFFNVGQENGRRIEELGCLKNLKGELKIFHLERVNNKEEATGASLIEKPDIYELGFVWSGPSTSKNSDEEVLEGLEPHPNIKSLTIDGFRGYHFPPWIMSRRVGATTNLDKLIEVRLIDCLLCEEVPILGHLPLLKILELNSLISVRSLGHSFYYPNGTSGSSNGECSRQQNPPFWALQSFKLRNMVNLEEWIAAPHTMLADDSRVDHAFHSLEKLEIEYCPNIAIVPNHHFPSLQTLKIRGVENGSWLDGMISTVSNARSLSTLDIIHVAGVTRVSCNGQRIKKLKIDACPDLQSVQFSSEGQLSSSSLKSFCVYKCEALTDIMLGDDLDYTSLETFTIYNCINVSVSNLEDFERMSNLGFLEIIGCPKLRKLLVGDTNCLRHLTTLRLGPLSEEGERNSFNRFCEMLQGILELQSLRKLELFGEPHWDSLPDQLQHLTALTRLYLWNFGAVEALPDWLGNLSSLEYLGIFEFKSLKELPSKEAMQRLTKLEYLDIINSLLLLEVKNSQNYHSEWPKISHIKTVHIR